jgi:hypothetical protein
MKSSDYRSPVCLQLTIKTLLLATTIVILLPAVVTSVPSTDGRRRQQLQQQHHQQQQQQPKRHVTFIINEDSPVGTVIGHIDQMTPQAAAESAGKAVARYVMLSGDLGDERPIRKQRPQTSPASELFAIDAATGVLTTRRVLNLESICPPSLFPGRQQQSAVVEDDNSCAVVFGVAVRQNAPSVVPNSIVAVTILVNDVNNKVPSFFHGRASGDKGKDHVTVARDVPESAPINEPVFRLPVARDADFNRKSNGRIAGYRLEPEDGPFTLQLATPGDGGDEDELTVALKSSLDREQTYV